ncbi:aAA-ATPase [Bacteroides sp. CAG:702]|nr:aAA-ATPase [Bacteroides sp. CAG:702]
MFHIDFNGTDFTRSGKLDDIIGGTVGTWEKEYGRTTEFEDIGKRFAYVLHQAHKRYGRRCVVLVDEYDKPILDVLDTGYTATIDGKERLLEDIHREILKSFYSTFKLADEDLQFVLLTGVTKFYSTFKLADEDLQFVLLTGVTKFSQVSVFSGFNQPSDISMDEQYETLCGITQEELERYFAEPIKALAVKYKVTEEGMLDMLKHRYDGYHFSGNLTDIYNPFSLLNAFAKKALRDYWFSSGTPTYLVRLLNHTQEDLRDYWFSSGTPTYLVRLLNHTQEDLNELTGRYYRPEEFVDYKADVEKPLPMIYQSGYLTIKGYEPVYERFLLDFPNNEVKNGFVSLIASDYLKSKENMGNWVIDVVESLKHGDLEQLRKLFTSFLASIPYSMRAKKDEAEKERFFHYTLYLIFRLISVYTVYTEKEQSQGRADCIVETDDYIYIFEFKRDGTADEALAQIEAKGYARPYEADLIFRLISVYTVYTEKEQSQGRADCIVETDDYIYIFEFKRDGTADEALAQIEAKGYARPYEADPRTLYKIGVNFSSETGTVEDWKTV